MSVTAGDAGPEPASRFAGFTSVWPAVLIFCVTLASAVVIGGSLRDGEVRALEIATATAHETVLSEVSHRMDDQIHGLQRLASNWERRGRLRRAEFEIEAAELVRDFSFLQAIEWADADFRVQWIVPSAGNEAAQGLDLAFETRRRAALESSRDEHATTISRPIQLVQGELGFIVYVPLDVEGRFDGFILGVYRADDLLFELLRNTAPGFGVRVSDAGEPLYVRDASEGVWTHARVSPVRGTPRSWLIEVVPGPDVFAIYRTGMPSVVVVAGAALALAFGITAHLARSRRLRNRQLAREVERRLIAQEELTNVINSHPDHVWSGEITSEGFKITYYSPVLGRIARVPSLTHNASRESWYQRVHEGDIENVRRLNAEFLKGERKGYDIEYRIFRGDGALAWVRDRVRSTPTERGRRIDGVLSDITETKRAESERLRIEKEKLLLLERQRMVREMHDGLGGHLMSAIAMVERGCSTQSEITEALRRALDDMRIAIDSLDPATADLTTSLGKLRARLEPLLRRNGMVLRWRMEDLPGLDDYPPEQTLHLLRIIQESVTNALRHSKAEEVSVCIRADDTDRDTLFIQIQDDGCGEGPEPVNAGRGIQIMKSRAVELGADFRFDFQESGSSIELRIAIPH